MKFFFWFFSLFLIFKSPTHHCRGRALKHINVSWDNWQSATLFLSLRFPINFVLLRVMTCLHVGRIKPLKSFAFPIPSYWQTAKKEEEEEELFRLLRCDLSSLRKEIGKSFSAEVFPFFTHKNGNLKKKSSRKSQTSTAVPKWRRGGREGGGKWDYHYFFHTINSWTNQMVEVEGKARNNNTQKLEISSLPSPSPSSPSPCTFSFLLKQFSNLSRQSSLPRALVERLNGMYTHLLSLFI